jgi:hypothetical protein
MPKSLQDQFFEVARDLEDHRIATQAEWLRAIRGGFRSAQEKDEFFAAIAASGERFRKLLELKWQLEREIRPQKP